MKERFIINLLNKKVEIDYPCRWLYKVIGSNETAMKQAIMGVVEGHDCSIALSNSSSGGKYLCFNVEVMVEDENSRNTLFQKNDL